MTLWRVFVGEPDERTMLHVRGLSWTEARDRLLAQIAEDYPTGTHDTCEHCAAKAREATQGLRDLQPETPGQWDIDWDEYILSRDEVPSG